MKLSELRALAAARIPGQWKIGGDYFGIHASSDGRNDVWPIFGISISHPLHKDNAEFVCALSNHIDLLLDVVEAVRDIRDCAEGQELNCLRRAGIALKALEKAE